MMRVRAVLARDLASRHVGTCMHERSREGKRGGGWRTGKMRMRAQLLLIVACLAGSALAKKPKKPRRRLHEGEECTATGPTCGGNLECACKSGRRLMGAPFRNGRAPGCTCEPAPMPPTPPPLPPALPPLPPPCHGNTAIVLVNNNENRDYANSLWTGETAVGSAGDVGCGGTWTEDATFPAYWTKAIGYEARFPHL